jgi:hypothetical protein
LQHTGAHSSAFTHSLPAIFAPVSDRSPGGGQRPELCSRRKSLLAPLVALLELGAAPAAPGGVPIENPASFTLPASPPLHRHATRAPSATAEKTKDDANESRRISTQALSLTSPIRSTLT